MRHLGIFVLACLASSVAGRAQAQTRWAVLGATTAESDAGRVIDLAEHSRAALEAQGETALARDRAVTRLETGLASPFVAAPEALARRLAQTAEIVLEDVAFGRNERALDVGSPLLEEIAPHVVALGRIEESVRDLSNLALFLVRAELQLRHDDRARARAEHALALVPNIDVDERMHPEIVRELLSNMRAELDAGTIGGTLAIQASATDPEGCSIRVNGRRVGQTPWVRVPLPAAQYAVQVECAEGVPGRVFPVRVEQGQPTRSTIPVRLASALDPRSLALVYDDSDELRSRLGGDVEQLGRILDVDRILIAVIDNGTMAVRAFEITRGSAAARLTGAAPVAEPADLDSSGIAVELARSGRRIGSSPTGEHVAQAGPSSGGDVGVAVLGGSLLTVGVVGLGIGWYFWSEIDARGQDLDTVSNPGELGEAQRRFDAARTPVLIAGAAGGALALAGTALLTSQSSEEVAWWTWVVGGVGVAVAAIGAYVMTTDGACYGNMATTTDACARRSPNWLLGSLVLEHAAPLLAVPITAWIQAAVRGSGASATTATLRIQHDGFWLSTSGSF